MFNLYWTCVGVHFISNSYLTASCVIYYIESVSASCSSGSFLMFFFTSLHCFLKDALLISHSH